MQFRKTIVMFFAAVMLVLVLAACSPPAVTEAPAESGDAAAAPAAESEAAATVPAATVVPAASEEEVSAVSMNGPEGCMAFSAIPTPDPALEALFPPPNAEDHVKGPAEASVTIMEYSDFQ